MDTIKRVLYAITKENLHTRREIADHLSISFVSVCKAINALTKAGIIDSYEKSVSDAGRRSGIVEVSRTANILLIDLTGNDFSYSLSAISEPTANIQKLARIDSLDFEGNLSLLISNIKRKLTTSPIKIAVALPGDVEDGKLINSYVTDYSCFDVAEYFGEYGLCPDVFVSGAIAAERFDGFNDGDVFISADGDIWGTYGRHKTEHIGCVPVSNGGLTYKDALNCSSADESIVKYSKRFLSSVKGVLSPERIFFSCARISNDGKMEIEADIDGIACVSAAEIILGGLMELCVDKILAEISNKR